MNLIGVKSRKASEKKVDIDTKNKVLKFYAELLDKENKSILRENSKDIKFAQNKGIKENLINRLRIDGVKLKNIKNSIIKISSLKDPVNVTLKKWIISSIAPKGSIIIDDGAKKALRSGKSLLAAGIKKISGKFNKGDHVKILDKKNNECARGLSSFTSDEIVKIMGNHSNQIEKLLGYVAKSEVIHKDDMVEV